MSQQTVLVVEDDILVRMLVVDDLEAAGFRVLQASNADKAIEILEREPDVWAIFTDIDMPGSMDGLKLAFAVRDRWPPVHIFVTSGQRMDDRHLLPEGSRFFPKPSDMERVISELRAL